MEVRKYVTIVEETVVEGGKKVDPPARKAAAVAVIKNPFAGKYVEKLDELIDIGEELGGILGKRAVEALKIPP
ncbi:MAG: amino acid synthesis family protein, partial [Desulfobacterales bacterium]|nr:amino acid synthesis family protein [Desulfobacterales bacterium]